MFSRLRAACVGLALLLPVALHGQALSQRVEAGIDQGLTLAREIAADVQIVSAVTAQNQALGVEYAGMTQERWEGLGEMNRLVRALAKNQAADVLRAKRTVGISEAFLSDASGRKVAFLSKPTNWCHLGKPKHDLPMSGQVWKGKLELDRSSGFRQIQIAVPVLQDGKAIGSLVIGLSFESMVDS